MVNLQMDDCVFSVDMEKTREHYLKHSLCDCPACRNYYAAVKSRLKKLDAFLCEFGVDITGPDEDVYKRQPDSTQKICTGLHFLRECQ